MQNERLSQEIHALTEVAKTLTSPLRLRDLLNAILDKIIEVLEPADAGAVVIWDSSSGLLRAQAAFGYDLDKLMQVGLRAGEAITGKVFDAGEAWLLSTPEQIVSAMEDMRDANRKYLAQSLPVDRLPICTIAAPITVGEQKFGVLIIETLEGEDIFKPNDLPFIQILADLIALAIERERLTARADSTRAAQQQEHLESELLATLSHELRLPLTAIKGYTSALRLEDVEWSDDKQAEFLALIEEECDNMQVLMTELIDTSIIEPGQLSIEPQLINLSLLARETAKEIQFRTEKHNLLVEFPTDFPEIEADPHRIRQVLRNILDNAIKYSPEGGLIVLQGESRENDIVVHIADQGIGISPEELIPLFEKYHRAEKPGTLKIPGMGLGLPIARALIESHGGRIWAESKPDQGTTISFSLPIIQSAH